MLQTGPEWDPGTTAVPGFYRNRGPMVVRLLRNTATDLPAEGLYQCSIDDATFIHELYFGLYNSERGMHHKLCCRCI